MLAKLLRRLGWLAYAAGVAVLFVLSGYWAFNQFVRRGVTNVPEVVGLELAEAEDVLHEAGLRPRRGQEPERFDETVPAGSILRQSPTGRSLVKRRSSVELVVSRGPELVEIPELRGVALRAAQVALSAAGLSLVSTASIYSMGGTPGSVVEQYPLPGARVSRTTPVRLFLCREVRAGTFVMPDLIYRDYDRVREFFERRGLRLGSVKFEEYEGIGAGIVLRQFPLAGYPLGIGDVISLVVAGPGERSGER